MLTSIPAYTIWDRQSVDQSMQRQVWVQSKKDALAPKSSEIGILAVEGANEEASLAVHGTITQMKPGARSLVERNFSA